MAVTLTEKAATHVQNFLAKRGKGVALRLGVQRIEYFRLLRRLSFRNMRSIVFDQMLPKIANYWPRDHVARLLREAGLEDVRLAWVNQMSWSAIGTKPMERSA